MATPLNKGLWESVSVRSISGIVDGLPVSTKQPRSTYGISPEIHQELIQ